ncbi:MAG: AAA family ATPase, partial [Clostridiales bacterium]|nr:AAA family ATPase [Clostridiales bacterium]
MQIKEIEIKNFKSIRNLTMTNIDRALIIVGKNSTGK